MKIICSTKALAKIIQEAIHQQLGTITIAPIIGTIEFSNNKGEYRRISIDVDPKCKNTHINSRVDFIQFHKIMKFLFQLPDQPIVVEFEEYSENIISVKMSQFVQIINGSDFV